MNGKNTHNHTAPIGEKVAMKIKGVIKMEASNDFFQTSI